MAVTIIAPGTPSGDWVIRFFGKKMTCDGAMTLMRAALAAERAGRERSAAATARALRDIAEGVGGDNDHRAEAEDLR